jgi:hypothetical protein
MLSLMKEQMDKLIRKYGYVDLEEYISDYRLLIIDFEDSQMLFHLIYIPTMEIVSYSKPIQSVNTVIDNNEYCNGLHVVECRGYKCREFDNETLCKSCYNPEYLKHYELLNLTKDAKIFNNKLLIYTEHDYEEILPEVMYIYTNTYVCHGRDCDSYTSINITEKKRNELFDTMYSAFVKGYSPLRNYNHNLMVGPLPSELPIPEKI